jgi:lysine biosynthesis protein LysW
MAMAECPSCGGNVTIPGTPKMGQRVRCRSCDSILEVVWLDPIELDWPIEDFEEEFIEDEEEL